MEGYYKIYLRGTDTVSNWNDYQSTWPVWQGLIDTKDPFVDASVLYNVMGDITWGATSAITYSDVSCEARDLTLEKFAGCPCDESAWQYTTYDAAGRHSYTVLSETVVVRLLDSAIFTPTDGIVFTTTAAFNTEGRAVGIPYGIRAITVTINDAVWQTHIYGGGPTQH